MIQDIWRELEHKQKLRNKKTVGLLSRMQPKLITVEKILENDNDWSNYYRAVSFPLFIFI